MKVEVLNKGPRISFLRVDGRRVEVRVGQRLGERAHAAEDVMRFVVGRLTRPT